MAYPRRAIIVALVLLGLGLGAGPAVAGEDASRVVYEFVPGEHFVKVWPPGWHKAVDATGKDDKSYRTRWLPDGQGAAAAHDVMVLQIYSDERFAGRDPKGVLRRMALAQKDSCENLFGSPVQGFSAEGFPAARILLVCPQRSDAARGEVRVSHLVHGEAAAYLVSRVWKRPPFAEGELPITTAALREGEAELSIYSVCRAGHAGELCGGE